MPKPDLKSVKELLTNLDRQGRELRAAIEEARREREDLAALPLCRADVLDRWDHAIDHWRRQGANLLKPAFEAIASRPGKFERDDRPQNIPLLNERDLHLLLPALIPAEIKRNLREIVAGMDEPENAGPPWRERQKRLAELDAQIEGHEKALLELRREVESSGLSWSGGGIF